MYEIGAPGVTRTPDSQFRKLLSVSEVLEIRPAPSGVAGPRRAETAAAESEPRGHSAVREGKGIRPRARRISRESAGNLLLRRRPSRLGISHPQNVSPHRSSERS